MKNSVIQSFLKEQLRESIDIKQALLMDEATISIVEQICLLFSESLSSGHKIMLAGNGGSAADSQHLAAELVSRLDFDRPSLSALALTTDTSALTAIGNDYGYEHIFTRQLHAQARAGDIFVGITTSGKSANILRAFTECQKLKVRSVALCGQAGELDSLVDYCVRVPSRHTARIQECHILIGHLICSQVERLLFPDLSNKR